MTGTAARKVRAEVRRKCVDAEALQSGLTQLATQCYMKGGAAWEISFAAVPEFAELDVAVVHASAEADLDAGDRYALTTVFFELFIQLCALRGTPVTGETFRDLFRAFLDDAGYAGDNSEANPVIRTYYGLGLQHMRRQEESPPDPARTPALDRETELLTRRAAVAKALAEAAEVEAAAALKQAEAALTRAQAEQTLARAAAMLKRAREPDDAEEPAKAAPKRARLTDAAHEPAQAAPKRVLTRNRRNN